MGTGSRRWLRLSRPTATTHPNDERGNDDVEAFNFPATQFTRDRIHGSVDSPKLFVVGSRIRRGINCRRKGTIVGYPDGFRQADFDESAFFHQVRPARRTPPVPNHHGVSASLAVVCRVGHLSPLLIPETS